MNMFVSPQNNVLTVCELWNILKNKFVVSCEPLFLYLYVNQMHVSANIFCFVNHNVNFMRYVFYGKKLV